MSNYQPVAVLGGVAELRLRLAAGHRDYAIMLAGGLVLSRKTIGKASRSRFCVRNEIDGTSQVLSEDELWSLSNIGLALNSGALLDMAGDAGLNL